MRQGSNLEQARLLGSYEAAKELRRLQVDQSHAVDIFNIIVNANLWLMFQPLEGLLGAYIRQGGGGVLVNSQRPRSVQRLTAAHEYGHHVLKHDGSLDDTSDIEEFVEDFSSTRIYQESAAQAFATDFLMPPQLVNTLWDELGITDDPSPLQVYFLSLYMGTSYLATVYQLRSMNKISRHKTLELSPKKPLEIKREIGRGIGPADSRADIWPIDERHSGQTVEVGIGDELSLSLPEMPSTGFIWLMAGGNILDLQNVEAMTPRAEEKNSLQGNLFATDVSDEDMADDVAQPAQTDNLAFIRSEFELRDASLLSTGAGGNGHRYMTFRALRQGESELHLCRKRPWQLDKPAMQEFSIHVRVVGKPTGEAERGYLDTAKARDLPLTDLAV